MAKKAPSWHFPRAALAQSYLDSLAIGLVSARALFAPRRHGKTEFLKLDLTPLAIKEGYAVVYVNLWDNQQQPAGALIEALKTPEASRGVLSRLSDATAKRVKSVKISGKVTALAAEASAELDLKKPDVSSNELLELHGVLNKLAARKQTTILLLDEAHVLADAKHETLAASLRAGLDIRKDAIKVIFTGSSETTLRRMFGQIRQPFYNWAPIEPFPLLGRDYVEHQVETFNAISKYELSAAQGVRVFKALQGVPEYFRRFLDELATHPFDGIDAVLDRTQARIHEQQNYPEKWQKLKALDQHLLSMMVIQESSPHSLQTRTKLGKALRLGKAVETPSVQNAIRRLVASGIIVRLEHGSYRFEDAQFAQWLRRERE